MIKLQGTLGDIWIHIIYIVKAEASYNNKALTCVTLADGQIITVGNCIKDVIALIKQKEKE